MSVAIGSVRLPDRTCSSVDRSGEHLGTSYVYELGFWEAGEIATALIQRAATYEDAAIEAEHSHLEGQAELARSLRDHAAHLDSLARAFTQYGTVTVTVDSTDGR